MRIYPEANGRGIVDWSNMTSILIYIACIMQRVLFTGGTIGDLGELCFDFDVDGQSTIDTMSRLKKMFPWVPFCSITDNR